MNVRRLLTTLFLTLWCFSLKAQLGNTVILTNDLTLQSGSPDHHYLLHDFNSDGNLDIVTYGVKMTGDEFYNCLIYLENIGGAFPDTNYLDIGRYYQDWELSDIDNDGIKDIALTGGYDTLHWIKNFGTGAFSTVNSISLTYTGSIEFVSGDVDNDLDDDIIITHSVPGGSLEPFKIVYLEKTGAATYVEHLIDSLSGGSNHLKVELADLDGDLDLDVLFQSAKYMNLGAGSFSNITSISSFNPKNIVAADVDNDLDIDMIYASATTIQWVANDGLGNFGTPTTIASSLSLLRDINAKDMNGDGYPELFSAKNGAYIMMYPNTAGSFGAGISIDSSFYGGFDIVIEDLDNDLDNDIIICGETGGVRWQEQIAPLIFDSTEYLSDFHLMFHSDFINLDTDGDGDLDIIKSSNSHKMMFLYEQVSPYAYGPPVFIDTVAIDTRFRKADINNDIIDELIVFGKNVYSYGTAGSIPFNNVLISLPSGQDIELLELGDIDLDGDLDIVLIHGNQFSSYLNDGVGNFSVGQLIDTYRNTFELIDVDGDGDLDLLSDESGANQVLLYINTIGAFSTSTPIGPTTINNPDIISSADIDGDGDQDFLVYANLSDEFYLFTNDGTGSFTTSIVLSGAETKPFVLHNIAGDSLPEIIIPYSRKWMPNVGGTFYPTVAYHVGAFVNTDNKSVRFDDIDNDGDEDMCATAGLNVVAYPSMIFNDCEIFDTLTYSNWLCGGDNFTGSVVHPFTDSATITWNFPGVVSIVGDTVNQAINTGGVFSVTVNASTPYCTADTVIPVTVNVPTVSTGVSTTEFCADDNSIVLSGAPSGGAFSGLGVVSSTFNPSMVGSGNSSIVYTFTDSLGCSNSDTTLILVHPLPSVSISSPFDTICDYESPFAITASPTGGTFTSSAMIGGSFYPGVAPLGVNYVYYSYTDSFGCSNQDTLVIVVETCPTIGLDEFNETVSISPNPFNNSIEIQLNDVYAAGVQLQLLSNDARIIINQHYQDVPESILLDCSEVVPGHYFIRIIDSNTEEELTFPVIKR